MRDVELYRQLLGIQAPWKVETVEMSVPEQQVEVVVTHAPGVRFACPECGVLFSVYDHSEERACRHLDSCGFTTWRRARPPRVHCPEHGVRQVALPWAEPHSRFTRSKNQRRRFLPPYLCPLSPGSGMVVGIGLSITGEGGLRATARTIGAVIVPVATA